MTHSDESVYRLASLAHTLVSGTQTLCPEAAGAASLIDSLSKDAVFPPGRINLLAALLQTYQPALAPVEQLAAQAKPFIPATTIADEVAGFTAARRPHA